MTKFLTCVYNGLYGTSYGGRLNRDGYYKNSLKNIAQCLPAPIICYTSPEDMKLYNDHFSMCTNLQFKFYDLEKSYLHNKIKTIREANVEQFAQLNWCFRTVEIMWNKLFWMNDLFEEMDDEDYLFWIDAGLSNTNLFPVKYNSIQVDRPLMHDKEEYFHYDRVFNQKLISWIEQKAADDKCFAFCCMRLEHPYPVQFIETQKYNETIVAGLFGGKVKNLKKIVGAFKHIAEETIVCGTLLREEQILTILYNMHPEWFSVFKFNTWYHDDWGDCFHPQTELSFSRFVEEYINQ